MMMNMWATDTDRDDPTASDEEEEQTDMDKLCQTTSRESSVSSGSTRAPSPCSDTSDDRDLINCQSNSFDKTIPPATVSTTSTAGVPSVLWGDPVFVSTIGTAATTTLLTGCGRACLVVVGTKKQLKHWTHHRKSSTQSDWMQVVRPVSLSIPLQNTCALWKRKKAIGKIVPTKKRLRVGNAGEEIHLMLQKHLGADVIFDQELHVLAGIECPGTTSKRYRHYDIVFPQGSFDATVDRTLRDTAVREFLEETGISLATLGVHKAIPTSPWNQDAWCYHDATTYRSLLAWSDEHPVTVTLQHLGKTQQGVDSMAVFMCRLPATFATKPIHAGFCVAPPRELLSDDALLHVYRNTATKPLPSSTAAAGEPSREWIERSYTAHCREQTQEEEEAEEAKERKEYKERSKERSKARQEEEQEEEQEQEEQEQDMVAIPSVVCFKRKRREIAVLLPTSVCIKRTKATTRNLNVSRTITNNNHKASVTLISNPFDLLRT